MALKDSYSLQALYELSVATQDESIQEFEEFGSDQDIDFENYQPEEKRVKLLNRVKNFLFQSLDLDVDDSNFAIAFTGGMR